MVAIVRPAAEPQHRAVEADLRELADLPRSDREERVEPPRGEGDAQRGPQGGEQRALGEQLADDAPATGAHRRADRELALARCRAREQEVRHVAAGDEQDQQDRPEQQHDGLPAGADESLAQRLETEAPALLDAVLVGVCGSDARAQVVDLLAGGREVDAGAELADGLEPVRAALEQLLPGESERDEELVRTAVAERLGQHPDDPVALAVERDGRPTASGSAPNRRRNACALINATRVVALQVLLRREDAAVTGMDAEHVEEPRRDRCRGDPLGALASLERRGSVGPGAEAVEDGRLPEIVQLRDGEREARDPEPYRVWIATSRLSSPQPSERRRTASTTLKIAVVAPMPSASAITAAAVNPGVRSSPRTAKRTSRSSVSIRLRAQEGGGRVQAAEVPVSSTIRPSKSGSSGRHAAHSAGRASP